MVSARSWIVPSVAVITVLLGGCGGTSDVDAIKKTVDDIRQWQGATVSMCEETRKGSELGDWPPKATFYACDLRNLDEQGLRTLGLPARPPRTVRVCFAVQNDEVLVVGFAHYDGPCRRTRSE
jgi:hypothetical protein